MALLATEPDIVCLQETKIGRDGADAAMPATDGYHRHFHDSLIPGRAGVATLSREKASSVNRHVFGERGLDRQGRALVTEFDTFSVVNVYMPHGGRTGVNLPTKLTAFDRLLRYLREQDGKPVLLVGDLNVAHAEIDLARPKANRGRTMFTSAERARLDLLVELGYVDAFRHLHPDTPGYTWWPYAYDARERNVGWRLDYAFLSAPLVGHLASAETLAASGGSDHCPLVITLLAQTRPQSDAVG